jgi:NAD(P)-dependent dehydrogenase (short-subunit alcohol dehydrogenase family)
LLTACADLTDINEVGAVINNILGRFERVDVLVHTVGGYRAGTPLHETPLDTLKNMFELNTSTVFITNQAVIPPMLQQGFGKIINVAARPGLKGRPNMAAYSAAKAAVIRLTESTAEEVKAHGINVNCIVPGTIDTPENRKINPEVVHDNWVKPESLAEVILFLSSDAARDIHGAAIPVYGLT